MTPSVNPVQIFICYRRADTAGIAGRLSDRLVDQFGAEKVFLDVSVSPGNQFLAEVQSALSSCEVLLALIGPHWLDAVDEEGRARLWNPEDLVVREIRSVLDRGGRVIPVLVDGATLPTRGSLPGDLADMTRHQSFSLDHASFAADVAALAATLQRILPAPARRRAFPARTAVASAVGVLGLAAVTAIVTYLSSGRGPQTGDGPQPPPTTAVVAPSPATAPPVAASADGPAAVCTDVADGRASVQPNVTEDGKASGLTFCPARINGGRLPITGPFDLAGQVLGPVDRRKAVLLINYGDQATCDAFGNAPAIGAFLSRADVGSPDGRWSYTDHLGYDEAVTIARHYEFITAPPDSLDAIRTDRDTWNAAHPGKSGDYPGILSLPADTRVLATFDVPGGTFPGAKPCGSP